MRSHLLLRRRPFAPPRAGGPQQPLDDGKVVQKVPPGERQQQQTTTFAEIERIRRVKRVGIGLSAAAVAGSAALLHRPASGLLLPGVEAAATASAALAATAGLALAAARLLLGDRLHVEAEGARLFVEVVPDFAAPLPSSASSSSGPSSSSASSSLRPDGRPFLVVRDAGDGRGLGVYVAERRRTGAAAAENERGNSTPPSPFFPLPRGAFLGCYEGDLLSESAFWERYPSGVGDYCIGCGGGFCLDGGPLAERLREEEKEKESSSGGGEGGIRYSPCLINHSSRRANVSRITRRAERKVELYASRDLLPGEELLLDYGRRYWQGREAEEMD